MNLYSCFLHGDHETEQCPKCDTFNFSAPMDPCNFEPSLGEPLRASQFVLDLRITLDEWFQLIEQANGRHVNVKITKEWLQSSRHALAAWVHESARLARLEKTLRSIATSACCEGCSEAAKVARKALAS